MILSRIKFYADTPKSENNKLFTWVIDSILQVEERMLFFLKKKGWYIRAAWYEEINTETGEIITNTRIDINNIIDKTLSPKQDNRTIVLKTIDDIFPNNKIPINKT